jgi:hypothetical protein
MLAYAFLCIRCICTNTHLNCAVVYYSTICFKISLWNSYQEQLEMDTEISDCDIQNRMHNYCLSVKHMQSSNFVNEQK